MPDRMNPASSIVKRFVATVMKVKRLLPFLVMILTLSVAHPASAVETLDWEGLVPPLNHLQDPFAPLNEKQQRSTFDLWMVRKRKAAGRSGAGLDKLEKKSIAALAADGIDAEVLLQDIAEYTGNIEANKSRLVEELDGRDIKMPGYVLPTEFSGNKVVEFILVPYVGACVHTPPPPVNQLVHVKLEQGFENEGLFMPVWVTGRIHTGLSTQEVAFSDGEASIQSGYSISATDVMPYEE